MNVVIVSGHLGSTPELRHTKTGLAVSNFRVASKERDNVDGVWTERAEWHSIVVWGSQAEVCARFLDKGSAVIVHGRLKTRDYVDRDGSKRYRTEVVANTVEFGQRSKETDMQPIPAVQTQSPAQQDHQPSVGMNIPANQPIPQAPQAPPTAARTADAGPSLADEQIPF